MAQGNQKCFHGQHLQVWRTHTNPHFLRVRSSLTTHEPCEARWPLMSTVALERRHCPLLILSSVEGPQSSQHVLKASESHVKCILQHIAMPCWTPRSPHIDQHRTWTSWKGGDCHASSMQLLQGLIPASWNPWQILDMAGNPERLVLGISKKPSQPPCAQLPTASHVDLPGATATTCFDREKLHLGGLVAELTTHNSFLVVSFPGAGDWLMPVLLPALSRRH